MIDLKGFPAEIVADINQLQANYELISVAEKGMQGYLVFARNRLIDRKVAVKYYYWSDNLGHIEPSALAAMKSKAIIELHDAALVLGTKWARFITPYCVNGDVDTYLKSHRFGPREACRFVESLLSGVSALHQNDYVHRDIKSENILVSDLGLPLIADFGSVRQLGAGVDTATGSGNSALYRPPESYQFNVYGKSGDIYQCGIFLYYLLGGWLSYDAMKYLELDIKRKKKFDTETDENVRYDLVSEAMSSRVVAGRLLDYSTLSSAVSPAIVRLLKTATNVDPTKRYANPSEMMSQLSAAATSCLDWKWAEGMWCLKLPRREYRVAVDEGGQSTVLLCIGGGGWRRAPKSPDGGSFDELFSWVEKASRN